MRALLTALTLILAAPLAACGFQPMYAPIEGEGALGPITVAQIDGKAGHVLKTELDRMLAPTTVEGAPPQLLQIRLIENVSQLGIRLDESASRAELRLTARYTLTPSQAGARPLTGTLFAVVNYEIPVAAFGEIAAQDDARERAAEMLAQRMRAELAMRQAQARNARS